MALACSRARNAVQSLLSAKCFSADRAARAAPQGRLARQLREVAAEAAEPGWAALPAAAARATAFQAAAEALVYDALMLRVRARGSRKKENEQCELRLQAMGGATECTAGHAAQPPRRVRPPPRGPQRGDSGCRVCTAVPRAHVGPGLSSRQRALWRTF